MFRLLLLAIPLALAAPTSGYVKAQSAKETGWEDIGTKETDVGPVAGRHKELDGVDCLEATGHSTADIQKTKDVILDIEGNKSWSSADLRDSVVLNVDGGTIDYFQYLNNPPPIADRYWFLRGTILGESDGSWVFEWERIDGAVDYPAKHALLMKGREGAVEVGINVGSWAILPAEQGHIVRFRTCTDVGGLVPRWAGEAAAKAMLPKNVVDLVNEVKRRGG